LAYASAFPTQSLRGLGATSADARKLLLAQAKRDFVAACDELVSGTIRVCASLKANASFFAKKRTAEVCDRIVDNVKMGVDRLQQKNETGEPYFIRHPEKAESLLLLIQKNADEDIKEYKQLLIDTGFVDLFGDYGWASIRQVIKQFVEKAMRVLQVVIEATVEGAIKAPIAAAAIGLTAVVGVVGIVLWFSSRR